MPTILKTKNSVTTTVAPTTLQQGELAVNITDKKMWVGNAATTPVQLLGGGVTGDVVGPASATDNAISRFDGTTGKLIQNSLVTVSDTGAISAPVDASISGLTVGKGNGAVAINTAVGVNALAAATSTSDGLVAVGVNALYLCNTGYNNTAVGAYNLDANTSGNSNSGLGYAALSANTTGSSNTAIGSLALALNTTASNNTAVGYQSQYSNTTGGFNSTLGYQAGYSNTTGAIEAFGYRAGYSNTTGIYNTAIGNQSLYATSTGNNNTALGVQALQANTTASNNTAVGYQAGYSNTTGTQNVAIGGSALYTNTTASSNTAVGYRASYLNTTGTQNCSFGQDALYSNTTGSQNCAFGYYAMILNTTGGNNTAMGREALYSNTTASSNVAIGYQAGYSNTTNNGNAYVGYQAGYATTGSYNAFFGNGAGGLVTSGSKNTIIGGYNGNQGGLDIRTASNYIVLSDGDGNPRAFWDNNGTGTTTSSFTDGYSLIVKNSQATRPYVMQLKMSGASPNNATQSFLDCEDTTNLKAVIYSNGSISNRTGTYNTISDINIKQDVKDATSQWDDIKAIRFRKYRLIDDVNANADAPYLMGVVAQELQQTSPNLIDECYDKEGNLTLSVKQSIIFMKAAKALQEAMERIETLEAKVTALENK